jgi:hypothetical protein
MVFPMQVCDRSLSPASALCLVLPRHNFDRLVETVYGVLVLSYCPMFILEKRAF